MILCDKRGPAGLSLFVAGNSLRAFRPYISFRATCLKGGKDDAKYHAKPTVQTALYTMLGKVNYGPLSEKWRLERERFTIHCLRLK
jgi:hypothetical protein